MNTEGEYAESRHLRLHRWVSVTLVAVAAAFYAIRFGVAVTIRPFAAFILPLALIGFSDQLAIWAMRDSGGWLTSRNADGVVRLAGWLVLLILLGMRAMIYFSI